MSRQRDRDLIVTVTALAATALLVVLFQSGPAVNNSINDESSLRVKRDTVDEEDFGGGNSCPCVDIDECPTDEECAESWGKSSDGGELRAARGKGKGKGKGTADIDVNSAAAAALMEDRYNKQVNLAEMTNSAGAGIYRVKAYHNPESDDGSTAVMEHIQSLTGVQCNSKLSEGLPEISGTIGSVYVAWPSYISLFGDNKEAQVNQYMDFANKVFSHMQSTSPNTKVYGGGYTMANGKFKEITKRSPATPEAWPTKVSMNLGQPQWGLMVPSFLKKVNPQGQSVNSGNKCFFFWIIHDIARDYRQVLEDSIDFDSFAIQCTIYPIFVKPAGQSNQVNDHLIPAIMKGSDSSTVVNENLRGYDILDASDNMFTDNVYERMFSYMCVVEHNALCRVQVKSWSPKEEKVKEEKVKAVKEPKEPKIEDEEEPTEEPTDEPTTEEPTTSTNDDTTTTKIEFDPIDSCCGRHPFDSAKFDVNTHVCCEYVNSEPKVGETC